MRPEYLSFCGINSFSKRVEIDFNKLLSGGIFGIFGDTGSGKTTILDAMIFALYGRIDRTRGGNGNEIINYNCDKASVTFDFYTESEGKRRLYRIEREIKKKNSMQSLTLSELDGGRIIPVSDGVKNTNQKIQEIVGLSFEDFKKCIALPQGEFAQFVKAERGERLKLISRLFGLDKYGELLNARIKKRMDAVKSDFDRTSGALLYYGTLDEQTVADQQKEFVRLAEQKKELDKSFAEFEKEHLDLQAAYDRTKKRKELAKKQETLRAQEETFRLLGERLSRFPAAKEIAGLDDQCKALREKIAVTERDCRNAEEQLKSTEVEQKSLAESFDAEKNAAETEEVTARLAKLETAKLDADDLREKNKKRNSLRGQYQEAAAKQSKLQEKDADLALQELELARSLQETGEGSLDLFLADNLDSALLTAEFRRLVAYFSEKQKELHEKYEDGELFRAVDTELSRQTEFYGQRLSGEKKQDVSALLEEYKRLQKVRQDLQTKQNKLHLERVRAAGELEALKKELARLTEEGSALKEEVRRLEEKIRTATGADAQSLEQSEKTLLQKRKTLQDEKRAFEQKSKDLEKRRNEIALSQARSQTSLEKLREEYKAAQAKTEELLQKNSFANTGEARALLAFIPDEKKAARELEEYKNECISVESRKKAFSAEGERDISEEEYSVSAAKLEELKKKKEDVSKACTVYEQNLENARAKLVEKKKLEKELSSYKARLDLISKLKELVKNNAFMEFVANEYLSDIAVAATGTLLQLTGGRYFIRYESGFFVGDNLCGGELRSVNTLSGGETFLVSLSLALSLSSAIYAKSLRPIEFFFLDEGFGTLDEKLIDTVMDSLEKLRNSHFSIGLISHVEELKHRIGNKIMVTGAAEGGSSDIQISY